MTYFPLIDPYFQILYIMIFYVVIIGLHKYNLCKTDIFLKVCAYQGDNTHSAPRSGVIERKIPQSVYRVLLAAEE